MTEQKEMRKIVNQLAPTPKTLPDDCPQFPVNSPDGMLVFNKYLGSRGNFTKICRFFENIGGADSNNTVRRILQSIMTNGLSLKYNWKGQGEKEAFSQYKHVINLVSVSVRNNPVCEKATDHEIETCIKKWLVHAKDREFGRSNRPYQRSSKQSSLKHQTYTSTF